MKIPKFISAAAIIGTILAACVWHSAQQHEQQKRTDAYNEAIAARDEGNAARWDLYHIPLTP